MIIVLKQNAPDVQVHEFCRELEGMGLQINDSKAVSYTHLLQRSLAGLHRVNDIFLDLSQLFVGQSALQQVDLGGADQRALALADELDALGGRIGALVELAGQVLHLSLIHI